MINPIILPNPQLGSGNWMVMGMSLGRRIVRVNPHSQIRNIKKPAIGCDPY